MKIVGVTFLFLITCAFATDYTIVEGNRHAKKWSEYTRSKSDNIRYLISILKKSTTGKQLLLKAKERANNHGKILEDIFEQGSGSLTDTTLLRRFSASNPLNVAYETKSKVYLNKDLSFKNAILDMSHELTHFIFRVAFNPYTKNFSLKQFIHSTVQGRGGEVEAFMMECKVYRELFPRGFRANYNCQKIVDSSGNISKARAVKHFYRVGNYFDTFISNLSNKGVLKSELPYIDDSSPSFISSAYGLPYPIAAYQEYVSVLSKACKNDKKRMHYVKKKQKRYPASMTALSEYREFMNDYRSRCQT
jgi:hypothetical protein